MSNQPKQRGTDCGTAAEWIHLYLDNELDAGRQQELQAHLDKCPTCRSSFEELRLLLAAQNRVEATFDAPPAGYFEEFPQRLMARIAAEERHVRNVPMWQPVRLAKWLRKMLGGRVKYAVSFAVAAALIFIITRQLQQPELSTTQAFSEQPEARQYAEASKSRAELEQSERDSLVGPSLSHFPLAEKIPASESPAPLESQMKEYFVKDDSFNYAPRQLDEMQSLQLPVATADLTPDALSKSSAAATSQEAAGAGAALSAKKVESSKASLRKKQTAALSSANVDETYAFSLSMPLAAGGEEFASTLKLAQVARSDSERIAVWQKYLEAAPESSYRDLAIGRLARNYITAVDSSSSTKLIEEALLFFNKNNGLIEAEMGKKVYAEEVNRLEELLQRKSLLEQEE